MLVYASLECPIGRKRCFHFLWKLGTFLWNGPFSTGEELYVREGPSAAAEWKEEAGQGGRRDSGK